MRIRLRVIVLSISTISLWTSALLAESQFLSESRQLEEVLDSVRSFRQPLLSKRRIDYSPRAVVERLENISGARRRLEAIRWHDWPISQRIDYLLVRSEIDRAEFEYRIVRPWERDPGLYVDMVRDVAFTELPASGKTLENFREDLRAIPLLLEQAREMGVGLVSARVTEVDVTSNRVKGIRFSNGRHVRTQHFVNAAGPYLNDVARMLEVDLPVYNELHLKVAFRDPKGVLPRNAPLLIWTDPQELPWSKEERDFLAEAEDTRWLLQDFPPGAHTRPEGGPESDIILFLWEFQEKIMEPVFPPPMDDQYPEVALRGLARMLPELSGYFERSLKPQLDGGYYTKTRENRPLIGPLPFSGAYVIGALSGFGLMTACAAGELLAAYIVGADLPSYAPAFSLDRYQDPEYQKLLANWPDSGQL